MSAALPATKYQRATSSATPPKAPKSVDGGDRWSLHSLYQVATYVATYQSEAQMQVVLRDVALRALHREQLGVRRSYSSQQLELR